MKYHLRIFYILLLPIVFKANYTTGQCSFLANKDTINTLNIDIPINTENSIPTWVDIDGDIDFDLFINFNNKNYFYKNIGDINNPHYVLQQETTSPLSNINHSPIFVDIDGDNDFDMFDDDNYFDYYENIGNKNSAIFSKASNNILYTKGSLSFVDIDNDDDLDAFVFDGSSIFYYKNIGNVTSPQFSKQSNSPFGGFSFIGWNNVIMTFNDLDSDTDKDLIIGQELGNLWYIKNSGDSINPIFLSIDIIAPYKGIDVGTNISPTFADIDNDKDQDLLVGEKEGRIYYYKNAGDSTNPNFIYQGNNFIDGIKTYGKNKPFLVDFDNDFDFDLIVGQYAGYIQLYTNIGTPQKPIFELQDDSINKSISTSSYDETPTFVDLDSDGDKDLIVGNISGTLVYKKNYGSSYVPNYILETGLTSPFYSIDVGDYSTPTFADMDGDNDFDLLVGEFYGGINYYENIGDSLNPLFQQKTLGNIDVGEWSTPFVVDIDNDKDLDLFVGENGGQIFYYENIGNKYAWQFDLQNTTSNPFENYDMGLYSAPTFEDLDDDGDFDAIIGESDGYLNYFENIGTDTHPAYIYHTNNLSPFDAVDVGSNSSLAFVDIDNDGDNDCFIGEYDGALNFYKNMGNKDSSIFLLLNDSLNPFYGVDVGYRSTPNFVDIDSDGDKDCFIGNQYNLDFFRNIGSAYNPIFIQDFITNPIPPSLLSKSDYYLAPTFVDIDDDGDNDCFIGDKIGVVLFYKNIGTSTNPSYAYQPDSLNPLDSIDIGSYSVPFFFDLDKDNDMDVLIGANDGFVIYYKNVGNAVNPIFQLENTEENPLYNIDLGSNSTPFLVDQNNNGNYNIYIGDEDGTVHSYLSSYIASTIPTILVSDSVICNGDSVILESSSAYNYNWSTGDTSKTTTIFQEGTYKVTVSNTSGCATTSEKITIYDPLSSLKVIQPSGSFNKGDSIQLSITGQQSEFDYTYHWMPDIFFSNSIISNPVVYLTDSTYVVLIQDVINGCLFSDSITFSFSQSLIRKQNFVENIIEVYPNPAQSTLNIELKNQEEIETIQLFSLLGTLIYDSQKKLSKAQIEIDQFANGIYLLTIYTKGRMVSTQVSIQH